MTYDPRLDFSPDKCANCGQDIKCDTDLLDMFGQDLWYVELPDGKRSAACEGGEHVPRRMVFKGILPEGDPNRCGACGHDVRHCTEVPKYNGSFSAPEPEHSCPECDAQ